MTTSSISIRPAVESDLSEIVRMLADDPLGSQRERSVDPLPNSYYAAFEAIQQDSNNELVVAEAKDGGIIAVLQLTFTPYITHQGGWRATIEAVRVDSQYRGSGLGRDLLTWAICRAQNHGCHLVQLTTDKERPKALKFYESLGFMASHEGMKLKLSEWPRNVT
ncbi:MAG: GNAT family N-acetyltransferase [Candidatus Competibacteraceae bacterium]|nr:MAG: GNAT family N-acetyltransferase [Candidatus Competibacteraceae bacterium]